MLPLFAAIFQIYRISPPSRASALTGQSGLGLFLLLVVWPFDRLRTGLRQQPEKLIRSQRQHPEHQVRHHFRISPDPDTRPAVIRDSGIAARLSCIEALESSALTGMPQSAVFRCSL